TPAGAYRFVVDGRRRHGGTAVDYHLASQEFVVKPWSGITADAAQLEPDGRVSFAVGPRHTYDVPIDSENNAPVPGEKPVKAEIGPIDYPDTYRSPARFILNRRTAVRDPDALNDPAKIEWYCFD